MAASGYYCLLEGTNSLVRDCKRWTHDYELVDAEQNHMNCESMKPMDSSSGARRAS